MAYGWSESRPILLRIVSRSFEAANASRAPEVPRTAPNPRAAPRFKKSRRLIPSSECIKTSPFEIDPNPLNPSWPSFDRHVPREHLLIGPQLPVHVLCNSIDVREIVQRDEGSLVHDNLSCLLQYRRPLLHIGRLLLLLN